MTPHGMSLALAGAAPHKQRAARRRARKPGLDEEVQLARRVRREVLAEVKQGPWVFIRDEGRAVDLGKALTQQAG